MNMSEHLLTEMTENQTRRESDQIYEAIQSLPVSEKAELVNRLLGSSGLSVVLGNNHSSGNLIVQINTMESTQLAELVRAVAGRIEEDKIGDE